MFIRWRMKPQSQSSPNTALAGAIKIGHLLHTTIRAIIMTRAVPTLRVGRNIRLLWVRVDG